MKLFVYLVFKLLSSLGMSPQSDRSQSVGDDFQKVENLEHSREPHSSSLMWDYAIMQKINFLA